MARGSHTIIDIDSCPVLHPGLANAFSIARGLAEALPGAKTFDARITLTANGPDVELRGIGALGGGARLALSRAAGHLDLARLANHNELVLQRRDPFVQMGPARVTPPPGGFLQATAAAEAALAEFAAGALAKSKRIADLFCGLGPFALRLAAFTKVDAYDSDAPAIKALALAAANTPGLKPLTAITRDLFRRPLLASELAAYDAVVIDPPRAGAEAQARQIASSRVQRIVWISCDAAAFARDARILVDAGYTLERVQPFDQFQFSAHLETAALFTRKVKR